MQMPKIQRNRWNHRINVADSQLLTSLVSKDSINEFSFAYKIIQIQNIYKESHWTNTGGTQQLCIHWAIWGQSLKRYNAISLDGKWIWRQFFTLMMLNYHVYACLIIYLTSLKFGCFLSFEYFSRSLGRNTQYYT